MHVDGFRLDAVRHLIEDGDVMNDTPETLAWLKGFETKVKSTRPDTMVVGEVWTNTEVVSDYVQRGTLDLAFEFDLAAAILDAASSGAKAKLAYTLDNVATSYPRNQFATMITNHDQDRVASVLHQDPAKLRLAAALLLTGPGVPFIYYGEEIGQIGAKPDEIDPQPDAMDWRRERRASRRAAKPWERLQRGFETRNVAAQTGDPASLLSFYRQADPVARGRAAPRTWRSARDSRRGATMYWPGRRGEAGRTLTVVANLGGTEVTGLRIEALVGRMRDLLAGETLDAGAGLQLAPRTVRVLAPAP